MPWRELLALACMSAAGLAYEVALTRYFAVAHYSEYGYWVISMAMAGLSLGGVLLSLFRRALLERAAALLRWLPLASLLCAGGGFFGVALNPFNALELQHPELWSGQFLNILKFYAALLPYFLCLGLYIGLLFMRRAEALPRLYAWDLAGAGLGAAAMLLAMNWLHPFQLPAALLLLPALASYLAGPRLATLATLAALEAALLLFNPARPCEYKPLAAALNAPGAEVLRRWSSPRGDFHLLRGFTERLDEDLSPNAGLLKAAPPPLALGLYQDGSRLASLPLPGGPGPADWFPAALEAFPYRLKPARVLLVGARGGFKPAEARAQGAREVVALEQDPGLRALIPGPALLAQPLGWLARHRGAFDLVDVSPDYSGPDQDRLAFTLESLRALLAAADEGGALALGLSIQEFGPYAAKLLRSLRELAGPQQVLAWRSAWGLRALVFRRPPPQSLRLELAAWCRERSFDVVWGAPRGEVFNDLPSLGWPAAEEAAPGAAARDALAEEAERVFAGRASALERDFDLRPATLDRPFFYSALRLSRPGALLKNIGLVPREELGTLVNAAVALQALLLGLGVLLLPRLARGRLDLRLASFARLAVYFAGLGLGYLFLEVALIEKLGPWLQDRAFTFSLVLCCLLVFSGLGSALAGRFSPGAALLGVFAWLALAWAGLDACLQAMGPWPFAAQALACAALIAPLAFFLGMPLPQGLQAIAGRGAALPWAWALNGAFSVLAPPLASLGGRELGFEAVAGLAALVYFLAWLAFPKTGDS